MTTIHFLDRYSMIYHRTIGIAVGAVNTGDNGGGRVLLVIRGRVLLVIRGDGTTSTTGSEEDSVTIGSLKSTIIPY